MKALTWMCLWLALRSARPRHRRQVVFPEEKACRTPDGGTGVCLSLPDCPSLQRNPDLSWLRRSICGYSGHQPRVCCPRSVAVGSVSSSTAPSASTPGERPRVGRPSVLPSDCGRSDKTGSRIIGGRKSELNAWPWLAAVYLTRSGLSRGTDCGGALVTDRHVITAAHCVVDGRGNTMRASSFSVRLGEHKLNDDNDGATPVDFPVLQIRRHPDFVPRTFKNDIAVLTLDGSVSFGKSVRPLCLPYDLPADDQLVGRNAFVAGWGTTAFDGTFNPELTEIQIPIWDNQECRRVFQREVPITREYICAGVNDGTKDSCQGDSGGPLMLPIEQSVSEFSRYYLIGVVSFGKRCATPGYPGVYTRVSLYLDWIAANLS